MKYLLLLILNCFFCFVCHAQYQIGLPDVYSYTNKDYKAGSQNWDIQQDRNGILYFANYEGLLTYNGHNWQLYPLPNNTVVRSVAIAADGNIYVGGQGEIGFFNPTLNGTLKYHSLTLKVPANDSDFADVWNIAVQGGQIYFRSNKEILRLTGNQITVFHTSSSWLYMVKVGERLFAQEAGNGLLELSGSSWKKVSIEAPLLNTSISGITQYDKGRLMITIGGSPYIVDQPRLSLLKLQGDMSAGKGRVSCVIAVGHDRFALGTFWGDCLIINNSGTVLQRISGTGGGIMKMMMDKDENLWLGTEGGIAMIALNSPIHYIYPKPNKPTSTYALQILDHSLYIGTGDGVYTSPIDTSNPDLSQSPGRFVEIKPSSGQVWDLLASNNTVLAGVQGGAAVLKKDHLENISGKIGTWTLMPVSHNPLGKSFIAGTFDGLHYLTLQNGKLKDRGKLAGLSESLRFLAMDEKTNTLWASHPYHGIYKIVLSKNRRQILGYKLYRQANGLPSSLNNYVFKIHKKVVIATESGIYEYDNHTDRMRPSAFFSKVFSTRGISYLTEDQLGNIWFVANKRVGLITLRGNSNEKDFTVTNFPELNYDLIPRFERIYSYDAQNILMTSGNGIIHLNLRRYLANSHACNVNITRVSTHGVIDSVLYGGYQSFSNNKLAGTMVSLPYSQNALRFEYASTIYSKQHNLLYSYKLIEFDKDWSPWSLNAEKEYTNLPAGRYKFAVRSKTNVDTVSKPAVFSFSVDAPWYASLMAYVIYGFLVAFFLLFVIGFQKKVHEKKAQKLKYLHRLELSDSEKMVTQLKNEKLEEEVSFKNKELTAITMHLIQKSKLLTRIKEEWSELGKSQTTLRDNVQYRKILTLLKESERNDADWDNFAVHFDQVHNGLLSKLKAKFPELSRNDLKMSAYVKMNLASKEIAQLMGVTVRAVEVGRYRLRKKLPISTEMGLYDYLISITSE